MPGRPAPSSAPFGRVGCRPIRSSGSPSRISRSTRRAPDPRSRWQRSAAVTRISRRVLAQLAERGLLASRRTCWWPPITDSPRSPQRWTSPSSSRLAGFRAPRAALGGLRPRRGAGGGAGGDSSLLHVGGHDPGGRPAPGGLPPNPGMGEGGVLPRRASSHARVFALEESAHRVAGGAVVVSLRWTRGRSATGIPGLEELPTCPPRPRWSATTPA